MTVKSILEKAGVLALLAFKRKRDCISGGPPGGYLPPRPPPRTATGADQMRTVLTALTFKSKMEGAIILVTE